MLEKLNKRFTSSEIYTISSLLILNVILIYCFFIETNVVSTFFYNLFLVFIIVVVSFFFEKKKNRGVLRQVYLIPFIFLVYTNVRVIIDVLFVNDFDIYLIKIDEFIFGTQVGFILNKIANPYLTEYLQICYFMFFIMPIMHITELSRRENHLEFDRLTRNIIFGFLFSYLLYLFVPAIGPRFTIFDFSKLSTELPGLYFTEAIRSIINVGGGIQLGSLNPAMDVNRDCMPSGHTMMTLINIYFAYKFKSKLRYFFYIIGFSLIFSTMYLRYHYFIDIVAGAIFAYISVRFESFIFVRLKKNG